MNESIVNLILVKVQLDFSKKSI